MGRGRGWRVWRGVRELARVGATAGAARGQLGEGQEGPAAAAPAPPMARCEKCPPGGHNPHHAETGERRGGTSDHLRTLAWGTGRWTRRPGVRRVDVDYRRQLVEPPRASTSPASPGPKPHSPLTAQPRATRAPAPGQDGTPPTPIASPQTIARTTRDERTGDMGIHTYGTMGVDWEERIRFDRLRDERLARIKALLQASDLGALLCFDMTNVRYITATHIGTWAQDKLNRFCLLPQGDEPIMWDFGSAARHHELYNPWLGDGRSRAGISTMRGAMSPESGRAESVARKIKVELEQRGLLDEPVGVDAIELPVLFALQKEGVKVVDGQQLMQQARVDQDARRDPAPQPRVHDGRRRLRGALPRHAPGLPRERVRRARQQGPVRDGLRAGRGRQRDLRRALLAPPPRLHRPRAPPGRPRLLRHPPELHGLPHVLLPHVRGRRARRGRSSTPTSAAATTSTRRSR